MDPMLPPNPTSYFQICYNPRMTAMDHTSDLAHADIGLVCALAMELDPFFERCERVRTIKGDKMRFRGGRLGKIRVAAVESGPGIGRATLATHALIDGHQPRWVLSVGFAGGLVDPLGIGDIVVADSVVRGDADSPDEIPISHGMPPDPKQGLHVGRVVTCDAIVRTVEQKRVLAANHAALACDMESHAVARVCQQRRQRFMVVRSLTDDTSADLPVEVHALLSATGARRVGATMGALWNRPESVKDLWSLHGTASKAAGRLAPFLASVIEQLHHAT